MLAEIMLFMITTKCAWKKIGIFNGKLLDDSPEFIDLVPEVVAEIRGYHKQKNC